VRRGENNNIALQQTEHLLLLLNNCFLLINNLNKDAMQVYMLRLGEHMKAVA